MESREGDDERHGVELAPACARCTVACTVWMASVFPAGRAWPQRRGRRQRVRRRVSARHASVAVAERHFASLAVTSNGRPRTTHRLTISWDRLGDQRSTSGPSGYAVRPAPMGAGNRCRSKRRARLEFQIVPLPAWRHQPLEPVVAPAKPCRASGGAASRSSSLNCTSPAPGEHRNRCISIGSPDGSRERVDCAAESPGVRQLHDRSTGAISWSGMRSS